MVSLDKCSIKVTGVVGIPFQKKLMSNIGCLNKTITTLQQSVIIAGFVKFTF